MYLWVCAVGVLILLFEVIREDASDENDKQNDVHEQAGHDAGLVLVGLTVHRPLF